MAHSVRYEDLCKCICQYHLFESFRKHCKMLSIVYIFKSVMYEYTLNTVSSEYNCLVQKLHDLQIKNAFENHFLSLAFVTINQISITIKILTINTRVGPRYLSTVD